MFNDVTWKEGERLTQEYMKKEGYKIVYTNYSCIGVELDIVAVWSKKNQIKEIKVKFLQSNTQKEYAFCSDSKSTVTIGRGIKCDIVHDGESVSKVHCTLKYENGEWVLYDGVNTSKEKKKSTNGLWLLANVSIALKDGMTLKTGIYKIMVMIKEGVN